MRGPDHGTSLESRDLKFAIKYIRSGLNSLGSNEKSVLNGELRIREKDCFSIETKNEIQYGFSS